MAKRKEDERNTKESFHILHLLCRERSSILAFTEVQSSGDVVLPVSEGTTLNGNLVSPCKLDNLCHFSLGIAYTRVNNEPSTFGYTERYWKCN